MRRSVTEHNGDCRRDCHHRLDAVLTITSAIAIVPRLEPRVFDDRLHVQMRQRDATATIGFYLSCNLLMSTIRQGVSLARAQMRTSEKIAIIGST